MPFEEPELLSEITEKETIAVGSGIRELAELRSEYGGTRWRKLKGVAFVRLKDKEFWAEVHWCECHGIGRRRLKVKRRLRRE
jgi:hypothetical protein